MPLQTEAEDALTIGKGLTVTVVFTVFTQPATEAPVTVYEEVLIGDIMYGLAILPSAHSYVAAPEAVNVADCPKQIVCAFTVTIGKEFTVMLLIAEPKQPGVVSETVYVVFVKGDTVNELPVVPPGNHV
jgi:hypothetical protein